MSPSSSVNRLTSRPMYAALASIRHSVASSSPIVSRSLDSIAARDSLQSYFQLLAFLGTKYWFISQYYFQKDSLRCRHSFRRCFGGCTVVLCCLFRASIGFPICNHRFGFPQFPCPLCLVSSRGRLLWLGLPILQRSPLSFPPLLSRLLPRRANVVYLSSVHLTFFLSLSSSLPLHHHLLRISMSFSRLDCGRRPWDPTWVRHFQFRQRGQCWVLTWIQRQNM